MKKRKGLRNLIFALIILIMCSSPIFAGCSFSLVGSSSQLEAPAISLYSTSMCIGWGNVNKAKYYSVYCNDVYLDKVYPSGGGTSCLYDFSSCLTEDGNYTFSVIAIPSYRLMQNSEESNKVTYSYDSRVKSVPIPTDTSVETLDGVDLKAQAQGTRISFTKLPDSDISGYELYLYSQSTGLNIYSITDTTIELQTSVYSLKHEIYAYALGIIQGNKHYVCTEVSYINPDSYTGYTDRIYTFDGYINDYYIDSLVELRNIAYYSFIYRIPTIDIKLSQSFENNIVSTYSGSSKGDKLATAYVDTFGYMYETRDAYSITCSYTQGNSREYSISVSYNDYLNSENLPACDTSYLPPEDSYYKELDWAPSYETTTLTLRKNDEKYNVNPYDDFVSDKQFLSTVVSSSEELYWAVENKVTPIPEEGSMAEEIYCLAKATLNSIISDQMTDYEKALAIFDWISANTSYDYYSLAEDGETYDTTSNTIIPSYYLEGVFITGFAVCDGFSKAFSLMCNMEGIDAIRIVGTAYTGTSYGGHAWNKVLIDKYPDDGVGAQYYLVDITWSAFNGSEDEISTHGYFLLGDDAVATTHVVFSRRQKFNYYNASVGFDYYNYQKFVYNKKSYDLVIDSDKDATALFYYMFVNQVRTMEVVVDYDYMRSVYRQAHPTALVSTYEDIVSATINKFRALKFNEQYFLLHTNYWAQGLYNDDGDLGATLVLEQYLLIDSNGEVGHLVEGLSHYGIEGKYKIYVEESFLGDVLGDNQVELVEELFASQLSEKGLEADFVYKSKEESGINTGEFKYLYEMSVSKVTTS